MKKVLLCSIAALVLFSSLILIAGTQECSASVTCDSTLGLNPAYLTATSDEGKIDLTITNGTSGTTLWVPYYSTEGIDYTPVGDINTYGQGLSYEDGLNSGFKLYLKLENETTHQTLKLGHVGDAMVTYLGNYLVILWNTADKGVTVSTGLVTASAVPVPPSVLLLSSGLLGLLGVGMRRRNDG